MARAKKSDKPYKGEIHYPQILYVNEDHSPYHPEEYGPNLGYIVRGHFTNHPQFRGLDAVGARTSLVVKHDADGNIETLNSRYKIVEGDI